MAAAGVATYITTELAVPVGLVEARHVTPPVLAVPLIPGDRAQSILYLDREQGKRPFTRDDLEWVAVLGSQLAIHLENIQLYQRPRTPSKSYVCLRRSWSGARSSPPSVASRVVSPTTSTT